MECRHHYWATTFFVGAVSKIGHSIFTTQFPYLIHSSTLTGNLKYWMAEVGLPDSSTAISCTPNLPVRTTGPTEGAPHYPTALRFYFYPTGISRRKPTLCSPVCFFDPNYLALSIFQTWSRIFHSLTSHRSYFLPNR